MISQPAVIAMLLTFDVAVIGAVGAFCHPLSSPGDEWSFFLATLGGAAGLAAAVLKLRWAYTIAALNSFSRQISETAIALCVALGAMIVFNVVAGGDAAPLRAWMLPWFLIAWSLLLLSRMALSKTLSRWAREGRMARRAVIVGGGQPAFELIERLDRSTDTSIQILGVFDDRDKFRSPETIGRLHKLGRFGDLVDFCRAQRVDLLIVALPTTAEQRILQILQMLWVLPIDVRIAAHSAKLKLSPRAYNYIGDMPFLPLFDKPMSDWSVAVKAIEDRLLAGLGLLLLSPLLALIALAVKWDSPGPVFFRQQRYGFNNKPIGVYKFRSMYADRCDAAASQLVVKCDPRVTRLGAFLRRSSLDELPQLFNVLKGELSLVGPRPHAMLAKAGGHTYDEVVEGYFARHKVKPGITGWAQINGWRGETDTVEKIEQRVAHDLYYIEHWSPWLDLTILLRTPLSLLASKNAY